MRTSKLLGDLVSCENWLFSLETNQSAQYKQSLILQKLQEQWSSFIFIEDIDGHDLIINPKSLHKYLLREGSKGQSQKAYRRILSRTLNLCSESWSNIYSLVIDLIDRGTPVHRIFGTSILSSGVFHFVQHKARLEHCLGLSDAVHMSMFNLGIRVGLPQKTRVSIRTSTPPLGAWVHFKTWNSKGSFLGTKYSTSQRRFLLLIHYLRVFPKDLKEKDYVKLIKLSLNGLFSTKMDQDLPEGYPEFSIPIFPKGTQDRLDRALTPNKSLRVRFYFNLIQSKGLCAPVGKDMVEEAYGKHHDSLCRPKDECVEVPQDLLERLRDYGRKVGRYIHEHGLYDPYSTKHPNTRATLECSGQKGGAAKALEGERSLCQGSRFTDILQRQCLDVESPRRMQPFVVSLHGPPGCGKTTSVTQVCSYFGKFFPKTSFNELIYSRSCSTKHWDGYCNQPIVVLDDFGQDLLNREDIVEFEQLISTNRYLVPMANLEEKGRCFNSPIIILTSNCAYGSPLVDSQGKPVVEEPIAVWRRISTPFVLSNHRFSLIDADTTLFHDHNVKSWEEKYTHPNPTGAGGRILQPKAKEMLKDKMGRPITSFLPGFENLRIDAMIEKVMDCFKSHIDYDVRFLAPEWTQKVASSRVRYARDDLDNGHVQISTSSDLKVPYLSEDYTLYQTFSSLPPSGAPRVKAIALSEPLKVRMITVAESEVKCLQPLQMALFAYLKKHPQFCLTNGCTKSTTFSNFEDQALAWVYRIEKQIESIRDQSKDGDLWLSGDYTAATDNFPMSVTHALMEGILEFIPHPSTRAWVRYECSPHIIEYPDGRLGEQTSGQLMGGLLSFPFLCFLNDFIVSEAGFPLGSYLINGDDVVARGPKTYIDTWRANAPKVGLSLSLGKNFIDQDFCTVNSQLFYEGHCLHTGKVSCQTRDNATIGFCFSETQFYYGGRDEIRHEFIRRNYHSLKKTVRSLTVDTHRGGLALFTRSDQMTQKEKSFAVKCYMHDRLKPFLRSQPVPGFTESDVDMRRNGGVVLRAVPIPCFHEDDPSVITMNRLRSIFGGDLIESEVEDLTHGDLFSLYKKVEAKCPGSLKTLLDTPLEYLPRKQDLGLHVKYVFVCKQMVGWILSQTLPLVIQLLETRLSGTPLEESNTDTDIIVEEVEFAAGCNELNNFINSHFVAEEISEPESSDDVSQDTEPFFHYDAYPRREVSKDDWLRSILQISEFAPTSPQVDRL